MHAFHQIPRAFPAPSDNDFSSGNTRAPASPSVATPHQTDNKWPARSRRLEQIPAVRGLNSAVHTCKVLRRLRPNRGLRRNTLNSREIRLTPLQKLGG